MLTEDTFVQLNGSIEAQCSALGACDRFVSSWKSFFNQAIMLFMNRRPLIEFLDTPKVDEKKYINRTHAFDDRRSD